MIAISLNSSNARITFIDMICMYIMYIYIYIMIYDAILIIFNYLL